MDDSHRRLELELRQLPGVSFATLVEATPGTVLQVVTVDPLAAEATANRAARLAVRHLDEPVHLEVWLGGAPNLPLAVETPLPSLEAISRVNAVRGTRGEIVSLAVTIAEERARATAEQHIRSRLGDVDHHRLTIEVEDRGEQNPSLADN